MYVLSERFSMTYIRLLYELNLEFYDRVNAQTHSY